MIKKYSEFINEKLGIVKGLSEMADIILDGLSDSDYFLLETEYLGETIKINCYIEDIKDLDGLFRVDGEREFTIKISKLDKFVIIHELKHLDRAIRTGLKTDPHFYINHIGSYVAKKYRMLFQNEFESHFNHIYHELDAITSDLKDHEKRKAIDKYLSESHIYLVYKNLYKKNFNISMFFKNNKSTNLFLNILYETIEKFSKKEDHYIKLGSVFKNTIKNIFKKEDDNIQKNDINYYINKSIKKNYKKFSRLYTLLDA